MIRTADIVRAIDMSRVERNEAIYRENEMANAGRGARVAGRVLKAIGVVLMVFVIAACLSLVIPKIAGYDAYVVVSGSMEPSIPVGSIVYSKPTEPETLVEGEVIVFKVPARGETPITHRVVINDPLTRTITTKGDANENMDANPVPYDNVVGKVVRYVPRVGFTVAMFTSAIGKLVAVLLLLEAWLLIEVGRRLMKKGVAADRE